MSQSKIHNLREELVGHTTVAVLSLLGFALYSLTYSIVYASSSNTPVVAVFEMWMVSCHLVISVACLLVQGVGVAAAKISQPLPHVAAAQTSVFLGLAVLATMIGMKCLQSGGIYCSAFYGAAAIPRFSAVGTFAWAWVMYVSSLGCQTWSGGGFSLGLTESGCLVVVSILILMPSSIIEKLYNTCPSSSEVVVAKLCNDNTFTCTTWLPATILFIGLFLYSIGVVFEYDPTKRIMIYTGVGCRLSGIFMVFICVVIYISMASSDQMDRLVFSIVLCIISLLSDIFYKTWRPIKRAGAKTASTKFAFDAKEIQKEYKDLMTIFS